MSRKTNLNTSKSRVEAYPYVKVASASESWIDLKRESIARRLTPGDASVPSIVKLLKTHTLV